MVDFISLNQSQIIMGHSTLVKRLATYYYLKGIVHYKYFGEVLKKCRKNNIKITLMNPEWNLQMISTR